MASKVQWLRSSSWWKGQDRQFLSIDYLNWKKKLEDSSRIKPLFGQARRINFSSGRCLHFSRKHYQSEILAISEGVWSIILIPRTLSCRISFYIMIIIILHFIMIFSWAPLIPNWSQSFSGFFSQVLWILQTLY